MSKNVNTAAKNRRRRFIKWICYGLLAVLLTVTENTWFTLHSPTPALLCVLVVTVALKEGSRDGCIFAILCGVFSDTAGGAQVCLTPVLFVTIAFFTGQLIRRYQPGFLLWLLSECCAATLYASFRLLCSAVAAKTLLSFPVLWGLFYPRFLSTVLWGIPVWFLVRLISACTAVHDRNVYVNRRAERIT